MARAPDPNVDTTSLPLEGPKGAFDVDQATDSLFDLLSDSDKDVDAFDGDDEGAGSKTEEADESSDDEEPSDPRRRKPKGKREDEEEEGEDDEESADEEEDEEGTSEPDEAGDKVTYKVKVDGEEVEVTQDELLRGYSRTQDYTRKTQELAERRRAAEALAAETAQERAAYRDRLSVLEQAIRASTPPEPEWDKLRASDPVRFAAEWAEKQRRTEALRAIEAEKQAVNEREQKQAYEQYRNVLQHEREALISAIPEWADENVARTEKQKLADYARAQYGYSDDDLDGVTDHRIMLILRKAQAYDALQSGKGKLIEKKAKAKVLTPGTKNLQPKSKGSRVSRAAERARQRLNKGGSVHDAAEVLFDMIGDD